ncbi:hypothetical protein C7M84_016894 [Penaeus vannamei]|uniref:Uncharacterized protein n=1 Tax=Penaeus vannamei TaxID=6689 RepID=A0A423SLU0_PENVA|nr:hypothetical protein C7M84_016894 [Penaeus vannamei]
MAPSFLGDMLMSALFHPTSYSLHFSLPPSFAQVHHISPANLILTLLRTMFIYTGSSSLHRALIAISLRYTPLARLCQRPSEIVSPLPPLHSPLVLVAYSAPWSLCLPLSFGPYILLSPLVLVAYSALWSLYSTLPPGPCSLLCPLVLVAYSAPGPYVFLCPLVPYPTLPLVPIRSCLLVPAPSPGPWSLYPTPPLRSYILLYSLVPTPYSVSWSLYPLLRPFPSALLRSLVPISSSVSWFLWLSLPLGFTPFSASWFLSSQVPRLSPVPVYSSPTSPPAPCSLPAPAPCSLPVPRPLFSSLSPVLSLSPPLFSPCPPPPVLSLPPPLPRSSAAPIPSCLSPSPISASSANSQPLLPLPFLCSASSSSSSTPQRLRKLLTQGGSVSLRASISDSPTAYSPSPALSLPGPPTPLFPSRPSNTSFPLPPFPQVPSPSLYHSLPGPPTPFFPFSVV